MVALEKTNDGRWDSKIIGDLSLDCPIYAMLGCDTEWTGLALKAGSEDTRRVLFWHQDEMQEGEIILPAVRFLANFTLRFPFVVLLGCVKISVFKIDADVRNSFPIVPLSTPTSSALTASLTAEAILSSES